MACFRHFVPLDFGRDRRTASDPSRTFSAELAAPKTSHG